MKRPYQQSVADLSHLSAHRAVTLRKRAEQFSLDDFPASFDAEQIFDATMKRSRKLERDRSGGGVLIGLQGADCLPRDARQVRQLFLRESLRLPFLAQVILHFELGSHLFPCALQQNR